MATITKRGLQPAAASAEVTGVLVVVTATAWAGDASVGTAIHEASSDTDHFDEIWLWASNFNTSTETLVLQWGTKAQQIGHFTTTINPNETVLVAPGWVLKGASTELLVTAFSTTANKVNITGYVNRIDQS
tara:strand:- start:268 stop:660 length:393 start_codon:yes stop_codon:yes gene_type:complete